MLAAERRIGAKADSIPPLPGRLRTLFAAAFMLLMSSAVPAEAQSGVSGWHFEDDGFADLWFHGLAVVGYHGVGAMPLYDPGYVRQARQERAAHGIEATSLEVERARILTMFQGDEAFEILHFVPVYFRGAGRSAAMESLEAIARAPSGIPRVIDQTTRVGTAVVSQILNTPAQRETLLAFVELLDEEWTSVVGPQWARSIARRESALAEIKARWQDTYATPLASFLESERLEQGTAILAAGLGAEGRFVPASDPLQRGPVVALSLPTTEVAVDAVLSSLVRELCYPAVRRAMAPFEARLGTRVEASRVSDLAATRCGELLLEQYAPTQVAAFRTRFGIRQSGTNRAFLSASGQVAGSAAFEGQLEEALTRELNLNLDGARAGALPVGRH